jgi:DNA-binding protein HU-beta
LKDIVTQISGRHGFKPNAISGMVADIFTSITTHLAEGDKVRIPQLGTFDVRSRPARMGRNLHTGEAVQIGASKRIAFKMAPKLKGAL